jgi:mono/diheme cytochrome c family protein
MTRARPWWWSVVLVLAVGAGCTRTPVSSDPAGEVLYARFCASCHGGGGRGDGPLAGQLSTAPSDLTMLARRPEGFDEGGLMAVIDGRRAVAAHGPREMPGWGVVFERELGEQLHTQYTVLLRARTLVDYLRTIQAAP